MRKLFLAALTAAVIGPVGQALAAVITIDDSDPNTITISANDFEGGFSVNGTQLQSGLGNPASITLPDGAHSLSGSYIDLGGNTGVQNTILFALVPGLVTSGVEFTITTDGFNGTLNGTLGGFTGGLYGILLPTFSQGGPSTTIDLGLPFLSVRFISEAVAVPAPAALGLFGLGLAGLLAARRRRA